MRPRIHLRNRLLKAGMSVGRRSVPNGREDNTVKIVDVARAGRVSAATVSRVLTNSPGVSEETRKRIRQLMADLSYHPHDVARRLATRATRNIMVVGTQTPGQVYAQPILGELFGAIEESLRANGYRCTVISRPDLEQDQMGRRLVKERGVDGVILIGPRLNDPFVSELLDEGFPSVTIGRSLGLVHACYVDIDNAAGVYSAVHTLIEMGHRSIAHVCGSLETTVGIERLECYRRTLLDAGMEYREDLVIAGGNSRAVAYANTIASFRRLVPRPTAVFVFNDYLALAVLRAIRELGLRVPADVAVIGFDDEEASSYLDPPLASVRAPIAEMGRQAVAMVLEQVHGEKIVQPQVILATDLVLRSSVGPPEST